MEKVVKQKFDQEFISQANEDDLFYFVDNNTLLSERITAPKYSYWKSVFRVFFKKKINWLILALLALILVMAFIFPSFITFDKMAHILDSGAKYLSPIDAMKYFNNDFFYILGSGSRGESIFLSVWFGARTSLSLAIICASINMLLGVVLGALWGYAKHLDAALNFVYNIIANVPYILLVSVLVFVIGRGFGPFVFALTITGWVGISYFFRTQVMIIRDREYNLASRCLGTRTITIVFRNILPFLISVIVTILATELPYYISMEVFLSYIGIGLDPELGSLGFLIQDFQSNFQVYPWGFWSPVSVAAALTIILYVLGQNLADASDPRTHMQ